MVWDLDRPLEQDCSLSVLKFDDDEGKRCTVELQYCGQIDPMQKSLMAVSQ